MAGPLVRSGYHVCGLDFEGHGLSPGVRALVHDYQHMVQDLTEFVRALKTDDTPVLLMGQSMGGGMSLLASVGSLRDALAGTVLLAPMLGIGETLRPPAWQVWTLSWAAYFLPWAAVTPVPSVRCFSSKEREGRKTKTRKKTKE